MQYYFCKPVCHNNLLKLLWTQFMDYIKQKMCCYAIYKIIVVWLELPDQATPTSFSEVVPSLSRTVYKSNEE